MSLPDDYLDYPLRRYGMDHDRYAWSMLPQRPPVHWPQGARLALWVVPALEWFPLNMKGQPFKPPGAMQTAYPDFRHYTLRDYGNRVGIFRIMQALEKHAIPASVAINAAVAQRYPSLVKSCLQRGWEIIANGMDMDHIHHGGLAEAEERQWISHSLEVLQRISGQRIRGWLSPAKSESHNTLDLLKEAGLDYVCDWVNDDMPYAMHTRAGELMAMPHDELVTALSSRLDDATQGRLGARWRHRTWARSWRRPSSVITRICTSMSSCRFRIPLGRRPCNWLIV